MKKLAGLLTLGWIGVAGSQALAGTFEYKLLHYPAAAGNCADVAKTLGAKLAQTYKVNVTKSQCDDVNKRGYDFTFAYENGAALNWISTEDDNNRLLGAPGIYTTLAACEAQMATETSQFSAATGLQPFVAFCFDEAEYPDDPHTWTLRMDAFGNAALLPFADSTHLFGSPIGFTEATFLDSVRKLLTMNGLVVGKTTLRQSIGFMLLDARYYAEKRLKSDSETYSRTDTVVECNEQLAAFQAILNKHKGSPRLSYCANMGTMGQVEVQSLFLGGEDLISHESTEVYADYAACVAAQPTATAHMGILLGRPMLGGICARAEETFAWHVVAFE